MKLPIGLQFLVNASMAYAPIGWPDHELLPIIQEMLEAGCPEREIAETIVHYLQLGFKGDWR